MRVTQVLFSLVFCSFFFGYSPVSKAAQVLDRIIVEVNNQVITESELQKRITDIRQQILKQKPAAPSRKQLRNKVLDRMVLDLLQTERAAQFGIRMSKADLNQRIEGIAKQNKISLKKLRSELLKDGINFQDFRDQVQRNTIIQRAQRRLVFNKIKVSDSEINQFLINQKKGGAKSSKYHLSHILISVPEDANSKAIQKARTKASKIIKRLNKGEAFDKLAIEFSSGQKALDGGDLGWRSASELPTLFVSSVKNLDTGDITQPIQSSSGFHILKLNAAQNTRRVIIEETLARHILIKVDELTRDEAARTRLVAVQKKLKAGADFAAMAKQYSEDPGSKGSGGSLGWSVPGAYVPEFEAVMKSLKKNQISNVFKSSFGWHIVQVLDRRKSDKTKQIERNKAYQAIQASKADEALELWLRSLRDEAYIKYHNPSDKPV